MISRAARILTLLLVAVLPVYAEPLLVITQGFNAQRVPTGAYAHFIDTENLDVSNGVLVSETRWTRNRITSTDESRMISLGALQSSRLNGAESATQYPVEIRFEPFQILSPATPYPDELVAAVPASIDNPHAPIVGLVYKTIQRGVLAYTLGDRTVSLPLSMQPVAAVPGPNEDSIVVIVRNGDTGEYGLQWCDTTGARSIHRVVPAGFNAEKFEVSLDHISRTPNNRRLILGFSGYRLSEANGDRRAWFEVWDLDQRKPLAASELLEGTWPAESTPILANDSGDIWTLTHTPSRGFAYLAKLHITDDTISLVKQLAFSGIRAVPQIARCPKGSQRNHIALATDTNIRLHNEALERYSALELDTAATALAWTVNAIYAGVDNRLLSFDESGAVTETARLTTGRISEIIPGLPIQTLPATPHESMFSRIPKRIEFDEDRIGLESYSLPKGIDPSTFSTPDWIQIQRANDAHFEVRVDPSYAATGRPLFGEITLHTDNPLAGKQSIIVHVRSKTDDETRLLWVRNPAAIEHSLLSEASPFSTIIRHVSRHPRAIQCDEIAAAGKINLEQYAGIVLTSATACYNALTRQEILDYLTAGGTVFYLASMHPGESEQQTPRWLEAVGMQVDATSAIQGRIEAPSHTGLLRHWASPTMTRGIRLTASDPRTRLIPAGEGDESAALAIGSYGRGRVVALASSTPLENPALNDPRALRFAESFFDLTRESVSTREDSDRDGIPDYIEDPNGNGQQDSGETDLFRSDSDGDGIPDGLEDINQNGFVDELETHPLLADTDEDGIPDPADPQPLPPTGTPYIASVSPNVMAAEGSRPIIITGRNFSLDSQVWFGPIQTPSFRVLSSSQLEAVVPPIPLSDSEAVALRVVNGATGQSAQIDNGFTYTPASAARFTLHSLRTAREVYGIYALQTQAIINPIDIDINLVKVVLEIEPAQAAEDVEIYSGLNIESPIISRVLAPGRILILVNDIPEVSRPIQLFRIQMRANMLEAGSDKMHMRLVEKVARSEYGGVFDTSEPTEILYDFASSFHPFTE